MHFSFNTDKGLRVYVEAFGYELELARHSCPDCDFEAYPNSPQAIASRMLSHYGLELEDRVIRCIACKEEMVTETNRPIAELDLKFLSEVHVCTATLGASAED